MAILLTIPRTSIPTGTLAWGPVACPAAVSGFELRIDRCTTVAPTTWPNAATILRLWVDISLDGGASWFVAVSGRNAGGIVVSREGDEVAEWVFGCAFVPHPTHLRGRLDVASGPLLTGGRVLTV